VTGSIALLLPLAADAAEEGKKVITGMLVVGLIFASIVVFGELIHWWRHLRRRS
jgi:hypothetical protein